MAKPSAFASFKIERTISQYEVACLLSCGMEGGIGYWACIVGYKKPKSLDVTLNKLSSEQYPDSPHTHTEVYKHIDYPLNPGGEVHIQVEEDAPEGAGVLKLTHDSLKRGLQVMADKYPTHFSHIGTGREDATTGDVFIQCCLFGEIVYG